MIYMFLSNIPSSGDIYSCLLVGCRVHATVVPAKSDSDVIFCQQLVRLSKTLTCTSHLS